MQNVSNVSLSLADRQALQRAQQLKFLKEQGLISEEKDVRGGAGVGSPRAVSQTTGRTAPRRFSASRPDEEIASSNRPNTRIVS
jgi:hypothetical protein